MSPDVLKYLRNYNEWRRVSDEYPAPDPKELGEKIEAACDELERLQNIQVNVCEPLSPELLEVRRLRGEITILNEKLRKKNIALDAMAWVWCNGGCNGGIYRRSDMQLTEEVVLTAERNTKRLREWYNNRKFREQWSAMTEDDRLIWLDEHNRFL